MTTIVDDAGDSVVELADAGFDTVTASVSHELAENVEKLILVGDANAGALGNSLDNEILGETVITTSLEVVAMTSSVVAVK